MIFTKMRLFLFTSFFFVGVASLSQNPRSFYTNVLPGGRSQTVNATFSQFLWDATHDIREQVLTSKFISGVKSGQLDPVDFGLFMMQDALWLDKSGDSMKLAADRVLYSYGIQLQSFLLRKSNSYNRYGTEFYNEWRLTDPTAIKQGGGCRAYHEYKHHVAETMDVGSFLACMIPCEKLWPWIGEQIMLNNSQTFGVYADWVASNLDPTYDGYKETEAFLEDVHAVDNLDSNKILEVYRNCMKGELEFFSNP